ncbi:uncharacterized protein LOC126836188 [Adelges cooleyi]|uniref:uncharacterized protein LOC126836188 n=1 Tax=Adelges cooleyi TaxID=133065 RepID=UPI00217F494F|nr:uncharacterized protein LOC126836188 [Adelges cooleyi]
MVNSNYYSDPHNSNQQTQSGTYLKVFAWTVSPWPHPPPDNLLDVTVHALYNPALLVPPNQRRSVRHSECTAILETPISGEMSAATLFARGGYTDDVTRENSNEVRWNSLQEDIPANVSATGQRFEYDGRAVMNTAKVLRPNDVMNRGPRYLWNLRHRFAMDSITSKAFQDTIFKSRYWPILFTIETSAAVYVSRISVAESVLISPNSGGDTFFALLDLSALMQPQCTSVRCISVVRPLHKKMHSGAFLDAIDMIRIIENKNEESSAKEFTTTMLEEPKNNTKEMSMSFVVVDVSVASSFYRQYLERLTLDVLELGFGVDKIEPPKSTKSAVIKFEETLRSIVETLMKNTTNDTNVDKHIKDLKDTGMYNTMVSSLSNDMKAYVSEKNLGPLICETVQSFVNRISADLAAKTEIVAESFEFPHSCPDGDGLQLKKKQMASYAREASESKQIERAKAYYENLISTAGTRCDPDYWLLYASFCLGRLDFNTALECVEEVLLVDGSNWIGLFLYAAIQLTIGEDENYKNCETVLKSLIMHRGDFNEPYVLLSVYYGLTEMHNARFMMLQKAKESVQWSVIGNIPNDSLCWKPIGNNEHPVIKCTVLLLKFELIEMAKYCLDIIKGSCDEYYYYMAVCEYKSGNYKESLDHLNSDILTPTASKEAMDMLRCLNDIEMNNRIDTMEKYLLSINEIKNARKEHHLIYLKGAQYYFDKECYTRAAEICLVACTVLWTPMILILLGKSLLKIGEVEVSENALAEANVIDNKNGEIWAYLAMANFKLGNIRRAKLCYEKALMHGVKEKDTQEIDKLLELF